MRYSGQMRFLLLLALLIAPRLALAAASAPFTSPRDEVRLISEANQAENGQVKLALAFNLQPGWHIYWQNPGDAGLPPQVRADAPVTLSAFSWPAPEFFSQGGVGAYVLSGHVILPFTASNAGDSVAVQARWLVCSDLCVPEHASFTLPLTGGASAEAGLFPAAPSIVPSPYTAHLAPDGTLSLTGPTATQVKSARFFPDSASVLVNDAPQPLSFTEDGLRLKLPLAGPAPAKLTGVLELTDPSGQMQALSLTAMPAPPASHAPWWLLALAGGLLLNLMPCVFPVLAMKGVAFARLGGAAHGHIRREALGYTAGVLVSMAALGGLLLGLRAAGFAAFWGFQFQSPVFVALAAWIILAAGLSLAGLVPSLHAGLHRPDSGAAQRPHRAVGGAGGDTLHRTVHGRGHRRRFGLAAFARHGAVPGAGAGACLAGAGAGRRAASGRSTSAPGQVDAGRAEDSGHPDVRHLRLVGLGAVPAGGARWASAAADRGRHAGARFAPSPGLRAGRCLCYCHFCTLPRRGLPSPCPALSLIARLHLPLCAPPGGRSSSTSPPPGASPAR